MAKREHDLLVEPRVQFDARMAVVIDAYELFVECNYEEPASKWRDLRVLMSYNTPTWATRWCFRATFVPRARC